MWSSCGAATATPVPGPQMKLRWDAALQTSPSRFLLMNDLPGALILPHVSEANDGL